MSPDPQCCTSNLIPSRAKGDRGLFRDQRRCVCGEHLQQLRMALARQHRDHSFVHTTARTAVWRLASTDKPAPPRPRRLVLAGAIAGTNEGA